MTEILAIAQAPEHDDALIAELSARRADRVTVLLADRRVEADPVADQRLAELVSRAEWVTGSVAVGVAAPDGALDEQPFASVLRAGRLAGEPALR